MLGGIAVIGTPSKTSSSLNFLGPVRTSSATSFEFPILENRTASLLGIRLIISLRHGMRNRLFSCLKLCKITS